MGYKILNCFVCIIFLITNCSASETPYQYEKRASGVINEIAEYLQRHTDHLTDYIPLSLDPSSTEEYLKMLNKYKKVIYYKKNRTINKNQSLLNLEYFIEARFNYLMNRQENIIKVNACKKNGETVVYPLTTDPNKYETLSENEKLKADITIDLYQTYNRIIVGLSSLIDSSAVPPEQKDYLMNSRLWPLIQGASDDWGHPDEAIFAPSEAEISDIEYYNYYVKRKNIGKTMPRGLPLSSFLIPTAIQPLAKVGSATVDDLLEGLTITKPCSKANKKSTSKKKTSGKKRSAHHSKTLCQLPSNAVVDADGSDIDDLPDTHTTLIPELEKELPTVPVDITQHAVDESLTITTDSVNKTHIKTDDQAQLLMASAIENEFVDHIDFDPRADHLNYQLLKAAKDNVKVTEYRNEESSTKTPSLVRGNHRQTLNHIFDEAAFHQISYDQFESLWINQGGVIPDPKSGGSHRSLFWNGQKVGSTFKPHGGHDYGPRCIKYLKDALEKIVPASLLSQVQGHK